MQRDNPFHSTLRLSYLQSGGKDHQILAHLQRLLDAAIKLETQGGKTSSPKTKRESEYSYALTVLLLCYHVTQGIKCLYCYAGQRDKYLSRELVSTELENQQLEEEIMKLELRMRTFKTTPNCIISDLTVSTLD